MKVPFVNLGAQFATQEAEFIELFTRLGRAGQYVLGEEVCKFEAGLAAICQTKYAITVGNGTDALELVLKAWGIGAGDEVITVPNSFIASGGAVASVGATPVFVDVGDDYNMDVEQLEAAITAKTKAIIPVHLTGNPANMTAINHIAKQHGLKVLEDAAQAIGATHNGKPVGGLGDASAFSLHPLKNLHLLGDAGFIATDDKALCEHLLKLRNHGLKNRNESEFWGRNSRLDNLQAGFGNLKLPHFPRWTARFQAIAAIYQERLQGLVELPQIDTQNQAVFHNFVIQIDDRTQFMAAMDDKGVDTKIHYPMPLHLMQCSASLGYKKGDFPVTEQQAERIVSLPIYPELTNAQVHYVCEQIKNYIESKDQ